MPDTVTAEPVIEFTSPMPSTAAPVPATIPANPIVPAQPTTMLDIIDRASRDPSVDIDKLERLIGLKKDMEAQQARVEFDRAMVSAQAEMKAIRADLENPQTRSKYASYAQLDKAIRPIYSKHGFAVSFNTGDAPRENELRVLATLSHGGGHRQDYRIDMPADGKGARGNDVMTKTHATGAAASYGQRYLYKLMFNLAVGDVDDDGNGAGGHDDDIEANAPADALRDRDGKLLSHYASDKAKKFTANAIETINLSANAEAVKDWRRANFKAPKGSNVSPLAWLEYHAPTEFLRVKTAYENVTGEGW
jgi:hypothetical protein